MLRSAMMTGARDARCGDQRAGADPSGPPDQRDRVARRRDRHWHAGAQPWDWRALN